MFGAGVAFLLILPLSPFDDFIWLQSFLSMVGKFCITSSFAIIYLYSGEIYPTGKRCGGECGW